MIARIALAVYRTVRTHVVVLVEAAKRWRGEKQEFERSPLAHPEKRGWEKEPGSLRNLPPVRVPEQSDVDVAKETGRHSRGSAA